MRWCQIPATWLHRFNSVCLLVVEASLRLGSLASQQSRDLFGRGLYRATPPTSPQRARDATRQSERDQRTLGSPPQRRYPQAAAPPPPGLPQALLNHPPLPVAQYPGLPRHLIEHHEVQRFRRMHPMTPPHPPPQLHHPPPIAPYPMHPAAPLAHGFPPPLPFAVQPGMEEMHRQYFGYPPPAHPHLLPAADIHPPRVDYAAALQQNFERDHAERRQRRRRRQRGAQIHDDEERGQLHDLQLLQVQQQLLQQQHQQRQREQQIQFAGGGTSCSASERAAATAPPVPSTK
ncbi:hypothetical protein EDD16DRAFT_1528037 [Pisolithus croceorrhizus]|nr:hypothetical protein EDD16DRAFT_1528037 [Pisolithus croceorrhizus]